MSHDFLHRTLIVIIMIYKRRYGWHKDAQVNYCSDSVKHYFTDEGVDRRNVWKEENIFVPPKASFANQYYKHQCSAFLFFCSEILCTEKNGGSKLCRQVESMRRQLDILPRLEKKLEEQQSLLEKTNEKFVFLSRAIKDVRENSKRSQVGILGWCLELSQQACSGSAFCLHFSREVFTPGWDICELVCVQYWKNVKIRQRVMQPDGGACRMP